MSDCLDSLRHTVKDLEGTISPLLKSHNTLSTEITRLISEIRASNRTLESSKRGTPATLASQVTAGHQQDNPVATKESSLRQQPVSSEPEVSRSVVASRNRYDSTFDYSKNWLTL
ncbi:hypothetical protein K3495_g11097 [Podosphaera aphanis]|nr:hypothetical protein K3495_g11097 [Podosphaera aphanis]